jgi:pyruvate formate lyase activating enzyme
MNSGQIFDIQRFSIHDGPGIRTTVFLKGCPLRCLWCGNPESIPREPSLSYLPDKCLACGDCADVCPEDAISFTPSGKAIVDRQRCTACGKCAPQCDPAALEMVGRSATAQEVLEVVLRDKPYYETSGGGMTLSGGEPLMQPEFAGALLREAKAAGLHTCVETSGYAVWGSIRKLVSLVDLWLYDIKESDNARHEKFVGKPREMIVENLRRLHAEGAKIILRCPMIPQYNARREHLDGIASLACGLPGIKGVQLLPYYDLWRAKLERFGLTTSLPETVKPPEASTVNAWEEYLRARGVTVIDGG